MAKFRLRTSAATVGGHGGKSLLGGRPAVIYEGVALTITLAGLALLSFILTLWQWIVAARFPLHQRTSQSGFTPGVTVLKPLKGCDAETETCLRSWFEQRYPGPMQILFGVASADDPVCTMVRKLIREYPNRSAELVICSKQLGPNAKISTLSHLEPQVVNHVLVISDADVWAPPDLLFNLLQPLASEDVGLVNCFYALAKPTNLAMRWEAIAVNADFWSQVLQSKSLKPLDFALGAVMAVRRSHLQEIGGFAALLEFLADDYQLGHKIAGRGYRIALCPVVVECRSEPTPWAAVWKHQLRWARTIRVCQPVPFFFSVLSNGTLWPLLWLAWRPGLLEAGVCSLFWLVRALSALSNQSRLTRRRWAWRDAWLVPVKDLLATLVWALAFVGNTIEWRGRRFRMLPDGRLGELP